MVGPSGWAGLFWTAFRRSSNAMVLVDSNRRFVQVNGAFAKLVGYSPRQLVGRPFRELVSHGPTLPERRWRKLLARSEFVGVTDLVRGDGSKVKVEFAGHPETVTGQRFVLLVAMRTGRRLRETSFTAEDSRVGTLSARELEVVDLAAAGLSGPEIAEKLYVSHNTVRAHVRNAMRKVGARSRTQLVAKVLAEGVLWDQEQPDEEQIG